MLSLIVETNQKNQLACHWVLETHTPEEAEKRISETPLMRGNKRTVYTNINPLTMGDVEGSPSTVFVDLGNVQDNSVLHICQDIHRLVLKMQN
jgi:hypothetical protein